MIKFWKSAAKGKTGCPVRPPEDCLSQSQQYQLDDNCINNIDDITVVFEKDSRLCLTLKNILNEPKFIKNFMMFMETLGNQIILKCWLELEQFRIKALTWNTNTEGNHNKLSHTKSLDIQCTCSSTSKSFDGFVTFNWRASSSSLNKIQKHLARNSCSNINDNFQVCDFCESKNVGDLTQEAVKLFKKYVALEAPYHLDIPDPLRKTLISNICQPEGQIKEDCFKPLQDYCFHEMETKYFDEFKKHPLYTKSQIDILTTGSIELKDILYNESILFYFTEYLEQESHSLLLEFLIAVTHFRDNLINGNTSPEQAQEDAIILYEKYFSLQAASPIGFSTEIRLKIESNICREEGTIATCFDIPYLIVYNTLNNFVKGFLESEVYYTYLSEMVKSVDLLSPSCKSQSDCSSEFSISTHNTSLAMNDPLYKKKRNLSVPDMTIDSNQLYNADALWQRKKHDGLSLGRINSLGRFESKLEPDPDKKNKSLLKKMVSKFVPTSSTSRVEEEMAWQIAHMIVKDVTDLTMAPPENEHED